MRIARELKIHSCHRCGRPLDDADFTQVGVQLTTRYRLFFDYICPDGACAYRGRYVVPLKGHVTCVRALQYLIEQIDDDDHLPESNVDWDSL
jgi:hypothetical protein